MRVVSILLLLALAATAAPPSARRFERADELEKRMRSRRRELAAAEEFARKTWHEKLVIRYAEGAERFDGRKISDTFVVRKILGWKELRTDKPSAESLRVAMRLPQALRARLVLPEPMPKALRFQASRPLVDALTSRYRALRDLAVTCLRALYGTDLFYEPDAPPGERAKTQRAWSREIRNRRR